MSFGGTRVGDSSAIVESNSRSGEQDSVAEGPGAWSAMILGGLSRIYGYALIACLCTSAVVVR